MRKQINALVASLMLLGLVGCGGEGSSNTNMNETQSMNVSVKLPTQSSTQKGQTEGQYKSFADDVNSVSLEVYDKDNSKLNTKAMTKDSSTGVWSVDLILNPDLAPFTFKAYAYAGTVSPDNKSDNTEIFRGESTSTSTETHVDIEIILTETDESIADSIRTLPSLVSVISAVQNDESIDLTFNLANKDADTITYELSSKNGSDEECTTSLFSDISESTVTFPTTDDSFTATLTVDEENCPNAKHYLKMTNTVGDSVNVLFTADYSTASVTIAKANQL